VVYVSDAVLLHYPSSSILEIHRVMGTYLKAAPHRDGGAGSGALLESSSLVFCSGSEQPDGSQSPTDDQESDIQSTHPDEETDVEVWTCFVLRRDIELRKHGSL